MASSAGKPSSLSALPSALDAITSNLPPTTDYMTYLTILESHLSPEILPKLNELLQDVELTQNIGWDLIHLLIPLKGAEGCLNTIARLGNPREVILQVTESLRVLRLDEAQDSESEGDTRQAPEPSAMGPTETERFCVLVSLLAILHPRIKTKYPSRFLSTSLMAVLSSYRPSNEATYSVMAFVHDISGKKRPALPQRKSSASSVFHLSGQTDASAPDPEATPEDPEEAAIQKKLLQSFVTHVLAEYINKNGVEWAARLQEHLAPKKVVKGKKSFGEAYREDLLLQERDVVVGQLVALSRDLGLEGYSFLFQAITATPTETVSDEDDENPPSSPDDVPLSHSGALFLVTAFIFSSILFNTNVSLPPFNIFPDHVKLVQHFLGTNGPSTVGTEDTGVIDAILAIGLSLENSNKFVSGPLEDEDFLQHIQTLSLLSANTPSPTLRYHAHILTSSILHAHPVDRIRLTFINDTLENCPYENLKGSAVGWLKEEIITANERKSNNLFSGTVALASTQPYIFPDMSAIANASDSEAWNEIQQSFPFHMAVINFIFFISAEAYASLVPPSMLSVVEEIYLGPLRVAQRRLELSLESGELKKEMESFELDVALREVRLLGERLTVCLE